MQVPGVSHYFIEITLSIVGFLLIVIDGLILYILQDIRERLTRLENKEMGIVLP